ERQDLLDYVKELAERLTKSERKELLDHVASLQLGDVGAGRDLDAWVQSAWTALVDAIGTGGAGMPGPLAIRGVLAARSAWAPVGFAELTVAQRASAYALLARLLVERCQGVARAVGAPLTAKMVANSTGDLAAVFEAAFPGYLRGGTAKHVFRMLVTRGLAEP